MINLNNIKKGIITTVVGIIMVFGALALKFTDESVTWLETIPAITFGLALLGINDPVFTKKD